AYAPATVKRKGLSHRRSFKLCIRACNGRGSLASRSRQSMCRFKLVSHAGWRAGLPNHAAEDHPLEEPITQKPVLRLLGNQFRERINGREPEPSPIAFRIT